LGYFFHFFGHSFQPLFFFLLYWIIIVMTIELKFSKMQGIGNDFVMVDAISQDVSSLDLPQLAQRICDRHFGIGGDGLILALPSSTCDFKMRIFNADGSEPQMCGNGIRCFARFVFDLGLTTKCDLSVETLAGTILPSIVSKEGQVTGVKVDMGKPVLTRAAIPIAGETPDSHVIDEPITVQGQPYRYTGVSMGNPHAVIFVDDLNAIKLPQVGPDFEHHPLFPERINTEFVQIMSRQEAKMVVWERGSGITLACGTGTCAILVAGVLTGRLDRHALIHLPGGDLIIDWPSDDASVIMTGPAEFVFEGTVALR